MLKVIAERRSIRKYKAQPLSEEQVNQLLEVALISPSARNLQPWHITVVNKADIILEMEQDIIQFFVDFGDTAVVENNKQRGNKIFYDAPVIFVISKDAANESGSLDTGIVAQSIALGAKSIGLDSVILGFPKVIFSSENNKKWKDRLKFPVGYDYGVAVAVGYGDETGISREIDKSKASII